MKLSILLAGSILTSAIVGNAYAQTCGAQPSCADLGYTLTSTADCIGTPLKCPFDKTKYNCVVVDDIVPKWNKSEYHYKWDGFSNKDQNTFTMPKTGCVWGMVGGRAQRYFIRFVASGSNPPSMGDMNNMPVSYGDGSAAHGGFFFCLKKGETFWIISEKQEIPLNVRFRVMYYN